MKNLEFYNTPEGEVMIHKVGEAEHLLLESDVDFVDKFLSHIIGFYPKAYEALAEEYKTASRNRTYYHFLIVRRFIKCNFGLYDNIVDIDEFGKFNFECVACPLRGECKLEKIVCFPEFNSTLSDRELAVMEKVYKGIPDVKISEMLYISQNTVNNHRKNSFKKLGVHSLSEFIRYASNHNLFKQ